MDFQIFTKSALRPLWSSSRDVSLCMYVSVPSQRYFFRGLSLALRSHDQFEASHWSTLLPYHMVVVVGGGVGRAGIFFFVAYLVCRIP